MGTKLFCKNCGKLNDKSSGFCMECGKPMPRDTILAKTIPNVACPECGAATPVDRQFCNNCGADRGKVTPQGTQEFLGGGPIVSDEEMGLCSHCGTVNFRFDPCFNCGQSLTSSGPVGSTEGLSASGRRRICSSCLGFHPVEDVVAFDGKHYCDECLRSMPL